MFTGKEHQESLLVAEPAQLGLPEARHKLLHGGLVIAEVEPQGQTGECQRRDPTHDRVGEELLPLSTRGETELGGGQLEGAENIEGDDQHPGEGGQEEEVHAHGQGQATHGAYEGQKGISYRLT